MPANTIFLPGTAYKISSIILQNPIGDSYPILSQNHPTFCPIFHPSGKESKIHTYFFVLERYFVAYDTRIFPHFAPSKFRHLKQRYGSAVNALSCAKELCGAILTADFIGHEYILSQFLSGYDMDTVRRMTPE